MIYYLLICQIKFCNSLEDTVIYLDLLDLLDRFRLVC